MDDLLKRMSRGRAQFYRTPYGVTASLLVPQSAARKFLFFGGPAASTSVDIGTDPNMVAFGGFRLGTSPVLHAFTRLLHGSFVEGPFFIVGSAPGFFNWWEIIDPEG